MHSYIGKSTLQPTNIALCFKAEFKWRWSENK